MWDLVGDVSGRRILDAGCGSGPLSAALRDRGAVVTGIDARAGMLKLARQRLGAAADRCRFVTTRLTILSPLWCCTTSRTGDRHWPSYNASFARTADPSCRFDHPFAIHLWQRLAGEKLSYLETRSPTEEWTMGGQTAQLTFWERPLHAMIDAFTAAGFHVNVISEPPPAATARDLFPEEFRELPFGNFLSLPVLRPVGGPWVIRWTLPRLPRTRRRRGSSR